MKPFFVGVFLLAAWAAAPAQAALRTPPEMQPAPAVAIPVASRKVVAPGAVRLAEPMPDEVSASDSGRSRAQIGFARTVQALRSSTEVSRHLAWIASGTDRQAAAVAITSPGASALRIALRMGSVPRGTRFIFAGASGAAVQVEAADVEATIARNVYYGEDSPAAHLFWSPVLEGDTAVVEIDMPATAVGADLHVAMPLVSHLVTSAARGFAGACGPSACDDEAGPADGNAVARIVFTEAGATYACNGMLVADRDPETVIPFFLTSRHCIASQSAASSAQPYWPHDRSTCGAVTPLDAGIQGATLLHADGSADLTLLRLQHAPPAGTAYAGWMLGTQRSAQANPGEIAPPPGLVQARYDEGKGPPSLRPVAASLGQCAAASGTSARFEAAYNAGLYQWLGGTPQDASDDETSGGGAGS